MQEESHTLSFSLHSTVHSTEVREAAITMMSGKIEERLRKLTPMQPSLDPCDTARAKAARGPFFYDPHAMACPVNLRTESRSLASAK